MIVFLILRAKTIFAKDY